MALTLLDLKGLAATNAVDASVVFHSAPVISDLRNTIVADFLEGNADVLLMLDSDQGLEARTICAC